MSSATVVAMRKLIVQQWVTVDNIAAEEDGGLSFVSGEPFSETTDPEFKARVMGFIDSVDTLILGANTYAQSKGYWPEDTRGALGTERFERLVEDGRHFDRAEAVALVLGQERPSPRRISPEREIAVLSRRELEVANLVAKGMTDREIAGELVISQRTAESHVQHILTKLGFKSRSQIAAWAVSREGRDENPEPRDRPR